MEDKSIIIYKKCVFHRIYMRLIDLFDLNYLHLGIRFFTDSAIGIKFYPLPKRFKIGFLPMSY